MRTLSVILVAVAGHLGGYETPLKDLLTISDNMSMHMLHDFTRDEDHQEVSFCLFWKEIRAIRVPFGYH